MSVVCAHTPPSIRPSPTGGRAVCQTALAAATMAPVARSETGPYSFRSPGRANFSWSPTHMSAPPTDLFGVTNRLEALERQNLRLRTLTWVAVIGVFLSPFITIALAPGTLFADRLSLRAYIDD